MDFDHVLVGGMGASLVKVRGGGRRVLRRRGKMQSGASARRRRRRPRHVDAVHAEREGAVLMARSAR
jgi:hypothetical protein